MRSQLTNLIKMELMSTKKNLLIYLLVPLVYPTLFRGAENTSVVSFLFCIAIIGFILFNGFAETDEKYKTGIMLNTLPVKRKEIIQARFISMVIVYAAITLVYMLSATALHLTYPQIFGSFHPEAIPVALVLVSFINAIQVPLYYVLDIQKSRIISMIFMFGIITLVSYLANQSGFAALIKDFSSLSLMLRNTMLLIVAAIIYMITCMVSQKLYERREL